MTRDELLALVAAELGVAAPTGAEIDALLAMAGEAAHASERTAAPLIAWMAGRAGVAPAEALAAVQRVVAG